MTRPRGEMLRRMWGFAEVGPLRATGLNDKGFALNKRALMLSVATVSLLTGHALADTNITTKVTSPVNTRNDGNITIESDGSIVITTSPPTGPAILINSDNALVFNNGGTITYTGVTGANAVELQTGYTGEFQSSGTIDLTGTGTAKVGILISGISSDINSGTFTGLVPSGGTAPVAINLETGSSLKIQGDESVGISQLSGTNIVGDIDIGGSLALSPTSATSVNTSVGNLIAINLLGTMTGNLNIQTGGSVVASGQGAEGIQLLGTLTGAITNQGTLQTYGTANITPTNVALPQAGTALGIGASVTGGIYNAGPSTTSDTTTARAIISTVGDAPTILINPTIGGVTPTANLEIGKYNDATDPGYSFLNRGNITDSSANANQTVTTFSIVGASTSAETVFDGGIFNGGSIQSTATTNTKAATVAANALFIGDYAIVPTLNNSSESNSGQILASVSGPESGTATAITIEPLGSLASINNSGTIAAAAVTTSPDFVTTLSSYAIFDESGTLSSITNSGTISATATTLKNNGQIAVAADLSVNTSGVNFDNSGKVVGSILFGTGNDTLTDTGTAQIPATITGNVSFGGTTNGNDTLTIGAFGTLSGAVTETLGSHVDVTIAQGGTLDLANTPDNLGAGNVTGLNAGFFDLNPGASLGLVVSQPFNLAVNPQTGALISSQSADIGDGTNFKITFGSYIGNFVPGKSGNPTNQTAIFDLLSAPKGSLVISNAELATIQGDFSTSIPFLFTGTLCVWNINGKNTCTGPSPDLSELVLDLTPKTPAELGLTGYALKMFPYANQALAVDDALGAALLNNVANAQEAQSAYTQFAPDVSGANRALAISLTDEASNVVSARQRTLRQYANQDGDLTMWGQQFVERLNQDNTSAGSGFVDTGFGFVLGADEGDPVDGRYGGAFTFFSGAMDAKAPALQKTTSEWYMLTGYTDWHGRGFFLDTQASVGYAHLAGNRTINLNGFVRNAESIRPAEYMAGGATAGLQYGFAGAAVMPQISLDGLAMRQEGYTETHGGGNIGDGFDLHIEPDYAASLRAFTGVDVRDDLNLGDFLLQPEARAGYRFDFANGQESVRANFVGVTPINQFEISGPKPSQGNAVAGGGLAVSTGAWSVGVGFDYLYANSGNTSEEGTITLLGRI
ncbi:MAG TPA: autotransporter domain-containing protein [Rhizomicrobium sp.]